MLVEDAVSRFAGAGRVPLPAGGCAEDPWYCVAAADPGVTLDLGGGSLNLCESGKSCLSV